MAPFASRQHVPTSQPARHREAGQGLILLALLAIPLLLMLALTVDVGFAYGQKRQTQNLADNAARSATDIVGKHISANSFAGLDADVQAAIHQVAQNSSAGFGAFAFAQCPTANDGQSSAVEALYIDAAGTTLSRVGEGDTSAAVGVRVIACKSIPTFFARAAGVEAMSLAASAAAVSDAVTGFDWGDPDFAPFAIWGGEQQQAGQFGFLGVGSGVIYRENRWTKVPSSPGTYGDVLSWASTQPGGPWQAQADCFNGDINHGVGWVDVGWLTTTCGNAMGQYSGMLYEHWLQQRPVIMPLVVAGSGNGTNLKLNIAGYVAVLLTENPLSVPSSQAYTGTITAMSVSGRGHHDGGSETPSGLPVIRATWMIE